MLCTKYREKLARRERFLLGLWKWRALLLAGALLLVVAALLLGLCGVVFHAEIASVVYGETPAPTGYALFRKTRFEYRTEGGDWSEEVPLRCGNFEMRAVSSRLGGTPSYGRAIPFSILPRTAEIRIGDDDLRYGETPEVYASLVYDDELHADRFLFEEKTDGFFSVCADLGRVRILGSGGDDVTDCYALCAPQRTFLPIPRSLEITTPSKTWVYDGMPHREERFSVPGGDGLLEGHVIRAEFPEITEAGSAKNAPRITVFDGEEDVTRFYDITGNWGEIAIEKRPLTITTNSVSVPYDGTPHGAHGCTAEGLLDGHTLEYGGSDWTERTTVGTAENRAFLTPRVLQTGEDVTDNYEISVAYGTISVEKCPLTVTTGSAQFLYDGTPHRVPDVPTAKGIAAGEEVVFGASPEGTEAGTYPNTVSVAVYADGENVTGNYAVTTHFGTLTILQRTLTITTASAEFLYDGMPHEQEGYTLTPAAGEDVLAGHSVSVHMGTQVRAAGTVPNRAAVTISAAETDVTKNYHIIEKFGTLTVKKRTVYVTTGSAEFVYDGTPKRLDDYALAEGGDGLLAGDDIVRAWGAGVTAITDSANAVGTRENILSFAVENATGDVSANYEFLGGWGTLRVKSPIVVTLFSYQKQYDGMPLVYPENAYRITQMPPDVTAAELGIRVAGAHIVDAGEVTGTELLRGCAVTQCPEGHRVDFVGGALKVLPRRIELTSASAAKIRGETPLTEKSYRVSLGSLVEGQELSVEITGSLSPAAAEAENTFGEVAIYEKSRDVTNNYEIVLHCGTLRWLAPYGGAQ